MQFEKNEICILSNQSEKQFCPLKNVLLQKQEVILPRLPLFSNSLSPINAEGNIVKTQMVNF